MTTTSSTPGTEVAQVVSQATMALFAQMAVGIPESDDTEAYEHIVLQLLGAEGVDGLNAPWDTSTAEKLHGHRLKIESITRRASDYGEGLGMYLVLKGTDLNTGEGFVLTSGSVSVVAQMARIHYLRGLPALVELVIADTPTAKGYRPQHLKVLSMTVPQ